MMVWVCMLSVMAAQQNARPLPAQRGFLQQGTHVACTLFLTQVDITSVRHRHQDAQHVVPMF